MATRQISFKVPPGLWSGFKEQTDALFLARAPFLDHMIAREVHELRDDLVGCRLSLRAKRYISGKLKKQSAKSVNIDVDEATAAALNEAVREHNLVRDAFLCRMIIFLRSPDALLKYLEVPKFAVSRGLGWDLEQMPSSPIKAMEAVRDDALYYVRNHVRENWGCGIYKVELPAAYVWTACFLEDKDVPDTNAYRQDQKAMKAMAEAFDSFEAEALAVKPIAKKRRTK